MSTTLCTLYEGNYHFGIAALANSLSAAGFAGDLYVGYRGQLPAWVVAHDRFEKQGRRLKVDATFTINFVHLTTSQHFAYYKPRFMQEVFEAAGPSCDDVAYLDPDIVVKCPWSAFDGWMQTNICLFEDVNGYMPPTHPKRLQWSEFLAERGFSVVKPYDRYYNSGFVAVPRTARHFLDVWARLCELVYEYNGGLDDLKSGGPHQMFHSTDQDALNCALMCTAPDLNTIGPEGMDFAPGGYHFSHAIGKKKPWHGGHLAQALRGRAPGKASKAYLRFANFPLRPYGAFEFWRQKWSMRFASAVGRFYAQR